MLFGFEKFKMNLLSNESGGGGGTTTTAAPTGETSSTETPPAFVAPEWAKGINVGEDILKAPMFSTIKSVDDVVKGFYHAQKMVGADKIVVPNKNSSSDEWRNYYIKAGLPTSIDEYKPTLPASISEDAFSSELINKAYELNVKPDQLQEIVALMESRNDKLVEDYNKYEQEAIIETGKELRKEWGNGYDLQIARAGKVIKHFAGDESYEAIANSPLANDAAFLRLMAGIGEKLFKEDQFRDIPTVGSLTMTRSDAQAKINEIMGDMKSPYYNSDHAQHKDFVNKVLKYHEIIAEQ
jgi:hypothetical protein